MGLRRLTKGQVWARLASVEAFQRKPLVCLHDPGLVAQIKNRRGFVSIEKYEFGAVMVVGEVGRSGKCRYRVPTRRGD